MSIHGPPSGDRRLVFQRAFQWEPSEMDRTVMLVVGLEGLHARYAPNTVGRDGEVGTVTDGREEGQASEDANGDSDVDGGPDTVPGEGPPTEAPLSDLVERIDERRERSEEDLLEALFAERSFEAVESPWDDAGPERESAFGAVGEVIEAGEETYVVSKRNFCERCRYFSAPPEVRCSHGGTEIREFVDKDHVRVYSCPVVEERGIVDEES